MNYKFYYYEEEQLCFLSEKLNEKPSLDTIINNSFAIKISVEEKNVENLYNFFKENTIKQILSTSPNFITIDYSDIETCPFYSEDNFKKLKDLLEQVKNKCNESISNFIEGPVVQNNTEEQVAVAPNGEDID